MINYTCDPAVMQKNTLITPSNCLLCRTYRINARLECQLWEIMSMIFLESVRIVIPIKFPLVPISNAELNGRLLLNIHSSAVKETIRSHLSCSSASAVCGERAPKKGNIIFEHRPNCTCWASSHRVRNALLCMC